jgi:hypothetical protein
MQQRASLTSEKHFAMQRDCKRGKLQARCIGEIIKRYARPEVPSWKRVGQRLLNESGVLATKAAEANSG